VLFTVKNNKMLQTASKENECYEYSELRTTCITAIKAEF